MNTHYDSYAYLGQSPDPTGFTNNWLEARHSNQLFQKRYSDYPLYEEQPLTDNTSYSHILGNMFTKSVLSDLFFSGKNVKHLKKLICDSVYQQSHNNYKIDPEAQSTHNVLSVMRYMFIEHAKHWDHSYKEQIAELNLKVIMDIVPRVMSTIQQELSYQRDHGSQHMTMDRPLYVSSAGTRTNRSVSSVFV